MYTQKIVFLPINLGACKPVFYFLFYTPHLRRKSSTRRCFYHTDLVQNAVFHNFSRQIAFIQYSGPPKHAWTFNYSETVQKMSKITGRLEKRETGIRNRNGNRNRNRKRNGNGNRNGKRNLYINRDNIYLNLS